MTPDAKPRRPCCAVCLRAQSTCICQWITPTSHRVEVVVLQHPMEVVNAKGSARLLCLSLQHSQLITGEQFAEQMLQDLPGLATRSQAGEPGYKNTVLLYPDTPDERALGLPAPPALPQAWLQEPSKLRLIVLDGTWRQSRKMLYLNPLLQQLPRLVLRDTPASRYLIRKAQRPGQLSTLEATCLALMQIECHKTDFDPLLAAFDGFVAQQLSYRKPPHGSPTSTLQPTA